MKKKLFVVEDEVTVRRLLVLLLMSEGYEVVECYHGLHALEELDKHPDVAGIVSDKDMPHLGGVELLMALRERGVHLPFMLLSGGVGTVSKTDHTPLEVVCERAGNAVFRFKPIWGEEFIGVVRSHIG